MVSNISLKIPLNIKLPNLLVWAEYAIKKHPHTDIFDIAKHMKLIVALWIRIKDLYDRVFLGCVK